MDISDDIRQLSTASRVNDAVGFVGDSVEGLYEPGIFLESAWVVWVGLCYGVTGIAATVAVRVVSARPSLVLVGDRYANADTNGNDGYEGNERADDLRR